jgi:MFS family permease
LPFVFPRIFKPTILEVFQISNTELGFYFSVYGIVAIGSYFFGGPLADRYSPRALMTLALVLTGLGGVSLSFIPAAGAMFWLYGFWGMTTILLFWSSLLRTTRLLGGESSQGKAFGILDGGRGLVAALVSVAGIFILAAFLPKGGGESSLEAKEEALKNVIWFFTAMVLLTAVIVYLVLSKLEENKEFLHRSTIGFSQVKQVVKMPEVWLQAVIILCAYSGYRVTDDFSLLASDILGYSDVDAAKLGSVAMWIRPLVAVLAGLTAFLFPVYDCRRIINGFSTFRFIQLRINYDSCEFYLSRNLCYERTLLRYYGRGKDSIGCHGNSGRFGICGRVSSRCVHGPINGLFFR